MLTKKPIFRMFFVLLVVLMMTSSASASPLYTALGTGFSYQGKLTDGGAPANGAYDLEFKLYDALTVGSQVGSTVTKNDVTVTAGVFTVQLDFGDVFNGTALYLEIGVRPGSDSGAYTPLTPRQPLSAAPYALYANNADLLDNQHASYFQNASNTNSGTLGAGFFSAYSDLGIEGYLANAANDLALNNGILQSTLNADLLDGKQASDFALSANLDADTLDGQHGSYYTAFSQNASNINTGTLGAGYYSAYADLLAEGYLGNAASDLALNNGTLNTSLNADQLDGQHGSYYAPTIHTHYSLDAADGSPTQQIYVENDGRVRIDTPAFSNNATVQIGSDDSDPLTSVWVFGKVDRDPATLTNLPQFATYLYGSGNGSTTARYGMSHYNGLTLNAYENDMGDPHWGVIKFYTGGDGLPMAERMRIDYAGNLGIGVTNPLYPIHLVSGAYVSAGGIWTNASDKNLKENFASVDDLTLLEKVNQLPITTWNYKAENGSVRHIGPMAQDFYAAFGLGGNDTSIGTVDADGIALSAIQGLYRVVQEKEAHISQLEEQNSALEKRVAALETPNGNINGPGSLFNAANLISLLASGLALYAVLRRRESKPLSSKYL